MKVSHNIILISSAAAALLFSGCGSASSDNGASANVEEAPAKVITVERGPLLDANVTDAVGQKGVELGNGQYAFGQNPQYPITARDGYIDVNRDGVINPGEVKNTLELKAVSGNVVTIATTVAADDKKAKVLQKKFNITKKDIETKTPGNSMPVEAFSNTLYTYSIENGYKTPSEISREELEKLADNYKAKYAAYQQDEGNVSSREEAMMGQLSVVSLDDADAGEAQSKLEEKIKQNKQEHKGYFDFGMSQSSAGTPQGTDGKMEQGSSYSSAGTTNSSSSAGYSSMGRENSSSSYSSAGGNHSQGGSYSSAGTVSSTFSEDYSSAGYENSSSSAGANSSYGESYSSTGADYMGQSGSRTPATSGFTGGF